MFEGEAAKRKEISLDATGNPGGIDSGESQMLQAESVLNPLTDSAGSILPGPLHRCAV